MKNIEKYEEELKKYGVYFALTKEGKLVSCKGIFCTSCSFYNCCSIKRMNWLLQEYKEPILTDEEKEYLSAVIKPFKNSILYIDKFKLVDGFQQIRITLEDEHYVSVIELPPFDNDMYKGMGTDKFYSLEDLGL